MTDPACPVLRNEPQVETRQQTLSSKTVRTRPPVGQTQAASRRSGLFPVMSGGEQGVGQATARRAWRAGRSGYRRRERPTTGSSVNADAPSPAAMLSPTAKASRLLEVTNSCLVDLT